jgi:GAF domain-containing protein
MRRGPKPAKSKEAKPPVARKSPKDDAARVRDLEKRLAEALRREKEGQEQQAATAEILRVISQLPTDVQPVFDTIVRNAVQLCGATYGSAYRIDGDVIYLVAETNLSGAGWERFRMTFPRPLRDGGVIRDVVESRRLLYLENVDTYPFSDAARALFATNSTRSLLTVPMIRQDQVIGAFSLFHPDPSGFRDGRIDLVRTFADQAVIAIENVRLFTELQEKNKALTEAHAQVTESLDQQTATSEILRVISQSPTDIQPVFDAVAESAARLCESSDADIWRRADDQLLLVAHYGAIPVGPVAEFGLPVVRGTVGGRSILEGRPIQVADVQAAADEFPESALRSRSAPAAENAWRTGFRTILSVPLMREGAAIGAIILRRTEARLFNDRHVALLQTFAAQALIAIENVRLFKELEARNRELTEALDRQTTTADVLRIIAQSPTELQPVLDAIATSAMRLCEASDAVIERLEGDRFYNAAHAGSQMKGLVGLPLPLTRQFPGGRAILDRRPIIIDDIQVVAQSDYPDTLELLKLNTIRSVAEIPLLSEGKPLGSLAVLRADVRPFTDAEIALLQTFADQAVIAIENVRLFNELEARNRDLTATGEILQIIARSPTDVQPVFDTIAESALRLCGAYDSTVLLLDGQNLRLVAHDGPIPSITLLPVVRGTVGGRAVLERRPVHVEDVQAEVEEFPEASGNARQFSFRTIVSVPLLREGQAIGILQLRRTEVAAFSDKEIALLKTFADQAVIAIENVRLFKELETRNHDLAEALDRQTATAEILRVISQSQTEVQPVFDAIVDNAMRLFRAWAAAISQLDGELLQTIAVRGGRPGLDQYLREQSRWSIHGPTPAARCVVERTVIHVPDTESDPFADGAIREVRRRGGMRSILAAPMLRDGQPIGAIWISRAEAGPFSPVEIALLQTFADQAVIAIQNTRLLGELQARTQELMRSVGELTALGEVGRAVSSTLDLETVLSTIVSRAIQLSGTDGGSVYEYDEATEEFSLRASRDLPEAYVEQVRDTRPRKGEGAVGRVAQTREPVQIPDISDQAAYESRVRNTLLRIGLRALLAVPLIAEDRLVGALIVMRKRTGTFEEEEVALLQTFATQSALAIQNARLFREIEEKSRQLEVASQHKSEFLANMSHELRTPLNAIIGFSEVLSDRMFGELNEKQEEYLKDIYASGTHLLSLINDILDLSKIEAGRMELELTDFDLPTAIENALMLVRERAGRRSIALHTNIDERLGQIQADERKVRQVVLNLLSNAIKFTPEGGRIEVSAVPKDGLVEVSVSDTGIGIAPEDQEKVFEEFRQVGTAAKKIEGTGLGLTLCRKFVELHGGKIWAKSEVGVGSTFTFTLPVRRGE